jgi:hypothetical protein
MNSSISRWLSSRGRGDPARRVQHDQPLRQIQVERAAPLARRQQGTERGIEGG